MKKFIFSILFSTLAIFTMSCDPEALAALTEALGLEKVPGCMNATNGKYDPLATSHVQDSCAVQKFGCTLLTAANFDPAATDMCDDISANQCCTSLLLGCLTQGFEEYNAQANQHDSTLCVNQITWGCMIQGSCNYNINAGSDCSNVSGGSNNSCCQAADTTAVVCVRDFDNDGFQDEGTTSQSLPSSGNCGCVTTLGFGWANADEINGEAIWGCMDPACPEYTEQCSTDEGCANKNDHNCCLGFDALDSLYMYGENYLDCLTDPAACVETAAFSLLGGYSVDMSACEGIATGPDDHSEKLLWYLGYNGTFSEERSNINLLSGYTAEYMHAPQYDSPQECGNYASGKDWVCGNLVSNTDDYMPCNNEYIEWECNARNDCWFEGPKCRANTSGVPGDNCFLQASMNSQSTCIANPGCHWDNYGCYFDCWGLSETACGLVANDGCWFKTPENNANDGYCSAPANSDWTCNELGASGGTCSNSTHNIKEDCENAGVCSNTIYTNYNDCNNGGSCSDATITNENACYSGGTCSDANFTNMNACYNCGTCFDTGTGTNQPFYNEGQCMAQGDTYNWYWGNCNWIYNQWTYATWYPEYNDWMPGQSSTWWDWNDNACKSEVDNVNNCAGCEAECGGKGAGYVWTLPSEAGAGECEQKPFGAECNIYFNAPDCNGADASKNCNWDSQWQQCYQEQGADCMAMNMQNSTSCIGADNCNWWIPPNYDINNVPEYLRSSVLDNPGVCNFYSLCDEWYCWDESSGRVCDGNYCNSDPDCRFEDVYGQEPRCVEDEINQYCDCYVEMGQSNCGASGTNTTWDTAKNECIQHIDEWACVYDDDIMMGPEDGNIDCGSFVSSTVDDFTQWRDYVGVAGGVCEHIMEDVVDGSWSLTGNTLCLEKDIEYVEDACGSLEYEECQCNDHRCHWAYTPTYQDPNAGMCNEGNMGRVQDVEHYKLKTHSSVFQDEMINYMFGSPPQCMSFSIQTNGNVYITGSKPDGSTCNIVLTPEG